MCSSTSRARKGGRFWRAQTTFDGDKTHALIALDHRAARQLLYDLEQLAKAALLPDEPVWAAAVVGDVLDPMADTLTPGRRTDTLRARLGAGGNAWGRGRRGRRSAQHPGAATIRRILDGGLAVIIVDKIAHHLQVYATSGSEEVRRQGGQAAPLLHRLSGELIARDDMAPVRLCGTVNGLAHGLAPPHEHTSNDRRADNPWEMSTRPHTVQLPSSHRSYRVWGSYGHPAAIIRNGCSSSVSQSMRDVFPMEEAYAMAETLNDAAHRLADSEKVNPQLTAAALASHPDSPRAPDLARNADLGRCVPACADGARPYTHVRELEDWRRWHGYQADAAAAIESCGSSATRHKELAGLPSFTDSRLR